MRLIQVHDLRRGFVMLTVDDADYDHVLALSKITIYFKEKGDVYVKTNGHERSLAVELLGAPPSGMVIDHENRDKLDFRRSNLRIVNLSVQAANKGIRKDNKTGFKGVTLDSRTGKYIACLNLGRTNRYYSYGHLTAESAAKSYDSLVQQHQPHATTNERLGLLHHR